eukprot:TRINITY_DN4197_c0_g1_i4.p2 TRINITY_DN4197_c0_g1~~TRINITY_DN4197_c0_g1_i4.p2  ORF type:complete len:148 (-),score=34.71 TRINITY_DN4197_c0_g1_i4:66-476(-)
MGDQDWTEVVFHKQAPKKKPGQRQEQSVAQARQQGSAVETFRKVNAGSNRQKQGPRNTTQLDDIENQESVGYKGLPRDVCLRIQQGRAAKGWTQKEFAQHINEKANVVVEYENGSCIPNPQILNKMEKALGVRVRG